MEKKFFLGASLNIIDNVHIIPSACAFIPFRIHMLFNIFAVQYVRSDVV